MENSQALGVTVLLKTDVPGSAEALKDALNKLSTSEVQVRVIGANVGGITVSDVQLAAASKALIIGFNVRADAGARDAVKETGVEIRYYSVIYEAIDDVRAMMTGLLSPEIKEQIVGTAQVRDVFRSSKFGVVAGCLVIEGSVKRNNPIRVLRENVVIFEGALESLRRFKDDVNEVRAGTECGIGVKNYQDVRVRATRSSASPAWRWRERSVTAFPLQRHGRAPSPAIGGSKGEMQRALSELISREVKDPRVGSVTITEVKVGRRHGCRRRCSSRPSPRRTRRKT